MTGAIFFQCLFRGFIVKDWMEDNKATTKFRKFNKIIIKQCMEFYFERWTKRNKIIHELIIQKEMLTKQAIRLRKEVEERGITMKRFARAHLINVDRVMVQYIKDWIQIVSNLFKEDKKGKIEIEDIRSYYMKKS